jgi:hypothetical protein
MTAAPMGWEGCREESHHYSHIFMLVKEDRHISVVSKKDKAALHVDGMDELTKNINRAATKIADHPRQCSTRRG